MLIDKNYSIEISLNSRKEETKKNNNNINNNKITRRTEEQKNNRFYSIYYTLFTLNIIHPLYDMCTSNSSTTNVLKKKRSV